VVRRLLLPALLLLASCSGGEAGDETQAPGVAEQAQAGAGRLLVPPAPLDRLAREAAERLTASAAPLGLDAANGLERLAVRLEREDWVERARHRFLDRLADPAPLSPAEARAFAERWAEVDFSVRWRERLVQEGHPVTVPPPRPAGALASVAAALEAGDDAGLLAAWGRAHAWFGHVWMDEVAGEAFSFDGFELRRVEGGYEATDLLGVARDFTLRRAGDHASLRYTRPGQTQFLRDRLVPGGAGPEHAHE